MASRYTHRPPERKPHTAGNRSLAPRYQTLVRSNHCQADAQRGPIGGSRSPITTRPATEVYIGAACLWLGGPGGGAAVLVDATTGERRQAVWAAAETTNSRAELTAVVEALRELPPGSQTVVYCASQYVLDGLQQLDAWAQAGWRRRGRRGARALTNGDLWRQVYRLRARRRASFEKVEAHAGIIEIEKADRLAFKAAVYAKNHTHGGPGSPTRPWRICRFAGDNEPEMLRNLGDVLFAGVDAEQYVDAAYLPSTTTTERRCSTHGYGTGRGAAQSLAHARTPHEISVEAHVGSHRDFLQRYVRAARHIAGELYSGTQSPEAGTFLSSLFRHATSYRMLKCGWDLTAQTGSLAQGVDGLNVDDYAGRADLLISTLRTLRTDLRDGAYHPSPLRRVYVAKPGGRGQRPIDIPIVEDRIVDRALVLTLAPLMEPGWHPCSIGFRTGHGPQDGLAMLAWALHTRRLATVQTADIRRAFTSLPKERLVHAVRRSLPAGVPEQLAKLVENIIQRPLPRGPNIRPGCGIAQGSPLSPLLLNLYLDRHLDWRWDHQRWPMIRYADDVLLLADSPQEAQAAVAALKTLLRPNGLNPRDDTPAPADLQAGDAVQWLGYTLRLNGTRLRTELAADAWDRLGDSLQAARRADDPSGRLTSQTVMGWLEYAAPTYRPGPQAKGARQALADRVSTMLAALGTDERRLPRRVIAHMWKRAHVRWRLRRRRIWALLRKAPWWGAGAPPRRSKTAANPG